jgi:hypothetical protein
VLEIDPDSAVAWSTVAATSALLGDLPRAQAALTETMRLWPNLSIETLRAVVASVPEPAVDEYLRGLRLAGWESDDAR